MGFKNQLIVLLFLASAVSDADAGDADQPMFTFGGFGSLGVSHSSQSLGDYTLEGSIPKGPGLSENWSATNDTRIAGQVGANFTPDLSAALQVDSEYHDGNTYRPEIEFMDVKYTVTSDVSLQVGRIALPTFMDARNRDIGYSYVWIHPPVEVYRQEPITHSDGVDATFRSQLGDWGNSIKAIYGKAKIDLNYGSTTSNISSRDLWGIYDTVEYGPTTIHVGYQARKSDSGFYLTGQNGEAIRDVDLSVGAIYDPGNWFAMSEWIQRKSTYKMDAMYVSAGYRVNKLTPYLTYSQNSQGSFLGGYPSATADALQLANRYQSTVSLGLRWDFMRHTDLKFQYDHVKLGDHSNGFLANVPDGVMLYGSTFHVISAVMDFVF
jgi:hypothetical protein